MNQNFNLETRCFNTIRLHTKEVDKITSFSSTHLKYRLPMQFSPPLRPPCLIHPVWQLDG
jgi:hypothetical protein